MYGKIINNKLIIAPTNYNGISNFNLNINLLKKEGFKEIEEKNYPSNSDDINNFTVSFLELPDKIIRTWTKTESNINTTVQNIDNNRILAYKEELDPLICSYFWGNNVTLTDIINKKAEIEYRYKKSNETTMLLKDFIKKLSYKYYLSKVYNIKNPKYLFVENISGEFFIENQDILHIRTTGKLKIYLPAIKNNAKIIIIENFSKYNNEIEPTVDNYIENNNTIINKKTTLELISNYETKCWNTFIINDLEQDVELLGLKEKLNKLKII